MPGIAALSHTLDASIPAPWMLHGFGTIGLEKLLGKEPMQEKLTVIEQFKNLLAEVPSGVYSLLATLIPLFGAVLLQNKKSEGFTGDRREKYRDVQRGSFYEQSTRNF